MHYSGCFLTGFLAGQRLKLWRAGLAEGAGGVSFFDWASGAGGGDPTGILTDPEAYARAVAGTNPRVFLNSDNTLIWQPTVDDMPEGYHVVFRNGSGRTATGGSQYSFGFMVDASSGWSGGNSTVYVTLNSDRRSWAVEARFGSAHGSWPLGLDDYYLTAVIDGTHSKNGSTAIVGYGNLSDGTLVNLGKNYTNYNDPVVMYAGRRYLRGCYSSQYSNMTSAGYSANYDAYTVKRFASAAFDNYLPTFVVTPHVTNPLTVIPRPGGLSGSPLNEEAKTFTNPLTGEIYEFTDFTYDAQTRTYTLTLTDGNKMDVQFADDGIKIKQGVGEDAKEETAMYPAAAPETPVIAPEDAVFDRDAFLSGLAAGMASHGFSI